MTPTLWRAGLRSLGRHPWQVGLSVLGVALGVAVVLAIDLANESARRAFALFTTSVAGRATHHVVGGPSGLAEQVYRRLRVEAGVRAAAPVVERTVAAPEHPGTTFHLLGIDPFADGAVRALAPADTAQAVGDLAGLLTRPGTALLARDTARRLGLEPGDRLVVRVGTARHALTLAGTLVPRDALGARAMQWLLVTDIATAQELLDVVGRLHRIDLIVPEGPAGEAWLRAVHAWLPPDARVLPASARAGAVDRLTGAFRLNLTALSLLALVVGLFLIYNTMTFSVVQRRALLGMLRALGVTRREVFALVLGEAAVIGAVATALGVPLGVALGQGLVGLVSRTINDLYVTLNAGALAIDPPSLVKAVVLGLAGTVAATLAPALEATATVPRAVLSRSALESRARRAAPGLAVAGGAALCAGWGLIRATDTGVIVAFAGLFAVLLGAALLIPLVTLGLMTAARPLLGWALGQLGRMAAGAVVQALSRTAVALAALTIAIAATVGVGVMVHSFRQTVVHWLTTALPADVYVSAPALVSSRPDATLPSGLVARVAATPGVAHVDRLRVARVESPGGAVQILALDAAQGGWAGFAFVEGGPPAGDAVIVSEPLAYWRRVGAGAVLRLATDRGERAFPVAGVYRDYGSSEGVVLLARATWERFWDDRAVSSLRVHAAPGLEPDALAAALRRAVGPDQDVLVRSTRALREASLEIFDRTFAVTVVLRTLATTVAFLGVLSALMALALERARELGILRAQGLTPREVRTLVVVQTGLMGLVAGLLAVPVGLGVAGVLVHVVNRRSFGWTLALEVPGALLAQAVLVAVVAAVLAGIYPAYRLGRLSVPEAIRDE